MPTSPSTLNDLSLVEQEVNALYPGATIRKPVPTGRTPASQAQVAAAAGSAASTIILGYAPSGVSVGSLIRELVAYRIADRTPITQAIANSIVTTVAPGRTDVNRVADLTAITAALAQSQPSSITSTVPAVYAAAATLAGTATSIGNLLAVTVVAIPNDDVTVAALTGSALGSLSSSVLSASAKSAYMLDPVNGFINIAIDAVSPTSARLVEAVAKQLFNASYTTIVGGPTALQQIISAAVLAVNTPTSSNIGALTIGALRAQPAAVATIKSQFGSVGGYADYTNTLVDAYSASANLGAFQTYLSTATATTKANLDAAAAGAIVRGVAGDLAVKEALTVLGSTTLPINVVQAAVGANLNAAATTAGGAINSATKLPWAGTYKDVAEGAVRAARDVSVGAVVGTLVSKTTATYTAIPLLEVQRIIDGAIVGAYSSDKPGTISSAVYNAVSYTKQTVNATGALVDKAIQTLYALDPNKSYVPALAALAGDGYGTRRVEIVNAATTRTNTETGSDPNAIIILNYGLNSVINIQTGGTVTAYVTTLNAFKSASSQGDTGVRDNSILAILYGASQANQGAIGATLATAVKFSSFPGNPAGDKALLDVLKSTATDANYVSTVTTLGLVADVAYHAKSTPTSVGDILDYIGQKIVGTPSATKDIAGAWTVIDPNHAHFVAHAVGFNNPTATATAITEIFRVTQITSPAASISDGLGGNVTGTIIDKPAAAAAITAGVVTGILETNTTGSRTDATTQASLVSAVSAAVLASYSQNNVLVKGPTIRLSTGVASDGGYTPATLATTGFTTTQSVGAAGAVTGFVAQLTQQGDKRLNATQFAVLKAAAQSLSNPGGDGLAVVQAAAQAFAWVSNGGTVLADLQQDIWDAVKTTYVATYFNETKVKFAVAFGVSEAANGVLGAGALGLNKNTNTVLASGNANADFYVHRSATGTPVTDIFNL